MVVLFPVRISRHLLEGEMAQRRRLISRYSMQARRVSRSGIMIQCKHRLFSGVKYFIEVPLVANRDGVLSMTS